MKRRIWIALALAGAALGPAACEEQPAAPETAPEAPEGISVSNARMLLPAVAGNPAAVYLDLANSSERPRVIRAVSVEGAGSAVLHETTETGMLETLQVVAPAGETLSFAPGGLHVMASDLADTIVAGGEAEVTVTFAGGDKVSFPADVRAAGDER